MITRFSLCGVLLVVASLALPSVILIGQGGGPTSGGVAPGQREGLIVVPFLNLSGQSADEWIGAAIAETVVADLKNAGSPFVLSPEAVRDALRIRASGLNASDGQAIALSRELKAVWLVAGAYQRSGDLVRITARLIDVRTGEITRTAKLDGRATDIFALQDRVTSALGIGAGGSGAARPDQAAERGPTAPTAPPLGGTPAARESAAAASAPAGAPPRGRAGGAGRPSPRGEAAVRGAAAAPAPPPIPPATLSRSPEGAVTVRAVRVSEPIKVDGRLDERVYKEVPAIVEYIQQEPQEGEPVSEKTESWVLFDDKNIYVSTRCWDSHPERNVANERRRDAGAIFQNENFSVIFDTFHDKRNGMFFQTGSLGGLRDGLVTDFNFNIDWNGVWDARTEKFDGGWTVEMAIPFKTLRYNNGPNQIWGINLRRVVKWKNEYASVMPLPAFLTTLRAFQRVSFAATLVGLEVPGAGKALELKPYGISGLRTDVNAKPAPFRNQVNRDYGLDAKYGITNSVTMDLTYNTDFAQVEDDTRQVNLTRFNLQFPERREFFLEGRGIFAFGEAGTAGSANSNTPILFFSRQIGLNTAGTTASPVPIVGGGRVTGKAGKYSIGFLNIQQDDDASAAARATNFTVMRVKRELLGRSNVGMMYTRRQETAGGSLGAAETYGIDGVFAASQSLTVNSYLARTRSPGVSGKDMSYTAKVDYNSERYGFQAEQLGVGTNFRPQVGFLRRVDFQRSFALARFSPRPARIHMKAIRQFTYQVSGEYLTNNAGRRDWTEAIGLFAMELQNSDKLTVSYLRDYEYIPRPFAIDTRSDTTVPVGGYNYQSGLVSYQLGTQHTIAGSVSYQQGTLYAGTRRTLGMSAGRVELSSRLLLEPTTSVHWADLPWGTFRTMVLANRTTFTVTPRMYVSSLVQYSSTIHALSTNTRLRWEYRPGSELFIVYSDGRDTDIIAHNSLPQLTNRAFIVKMNKLFRF